MSGILLEQIQDPEGRLVTTGTVDPETQQIQSSQNDFANEVNDEINKRVAEQGKTKQEVIAELNQNNAIAKVFEESSTESKDVDLSGIKNGESAIATGTAGDKIVGIGGKDIIASGEGDDTVSGNKGNDNIGGGAGADIIFGYKGTVGNDGTITLDNTSASPDDDTIDGGSGADKIFGQQGDDFLIGAGGADSIEGGTGNDLIYGDYADPALISTKFDFGNDTLSGGEGNDTIFGGRGADTIDGGTGDDSIIGGSGVDNLTGGTGNDVFVFNPQDIQATPDIITDFTKGQDKIDLRNFGTKGSISYDQTTGQLNVNGRTVPLADLGDNTSFDLEKSDFILDNENDWEIL